jgi:hypothetical protein
MGDNGFLQDMIAHGTAHEQAQATTEAPQPPDVSAVFGKAYTVGAKTVIPVARVSYVMGSGAKGQGKALTAQPVAVIEISVGRVRIQQIVNPLPIILGGMLVGAWNVYWIARAVREWRQMRAGG